MADLPKAAEVTQLVSLLAPGLIVLAIRARFKEGAVPELKDRVISYAVASTAYFAAVSPLFHVEAGLTLPSWVWGFLQFFAVPAAIGIFLVYLDQWDALYKITKKAGLRIVHHIPAAWDYAFANLRKGSYVLVRLTDGTEFAGIMGRLSFASSTTAERDLLLEEVWTVNTTGQWSRTEPRRAVLLCGKDIRSVEIFYRSDP